MKIQSKKIQEEEEKEEGVVEHMYFSQIHPF